MKKDKLSRKEREQLQRRTQILQAALELFSQKGYHNVSMQEIAARAEFAVGTIYNFFKNKEELYREVLMQPAILICSTLSKVLEEKGDEYITIKKYLETKCKLFMENISAIQLYFAEVGGGVRINVKRALDTELRIFYDQINRKVVTVFDQGIQKRIFHAFDPYYLALALDSISNAFIFEWMENPERFTDNTIADLVEKIFLERISLLPK